MRKALVCLALLAQAARANAEDELRTNVYADGTIIAVGGIGWILSSVYQSQLAPSVCKWCDRNVDGSDALNGVDGGIRDALKWSNTDAANTLSGAMGFVIAPTAALGLGALAADHDGRIKDWPYDAMIIVESAVLAADLNQTIKFLVGRERPYVHALAASQKPIDSEDNLSFYSGHTTLAFSLAVSSGTIASMRGYRYAPLVWATGLTVAVGTGYLRIAGDRHYFTDVLGGAAMGAIVGFLVPYVFHHSGTKMDASPVPGGAVITWSGTW
ncbi:MAG TPA: phosphatase PAP2 family protein [Haliangiales bacterium]|nr:phosphatase PAP2 family protein [Haliangiales bacterium]